MRRFLSLMALLAVSCLTAQDLAYADVGTPNDPPALAYRAETTTSSVDVVRKGRERTLLGDLDLTGVWAGPTYNYSSTGDDFALMRGGFGGLEFSEEFFIGYGSWKNREDFTVDEPVVGSPVYDFKHSGVIVAYAPFADNAIHPRVTAIFGPGRFELQKGSLPDVEEGRSDRFLVGQATVGLELNLFQWFRLGIDGGYRFASGVDNDNVTANDIGGAVIQAEARFGFSW